MKRTVTALFFLIFIFSGLPLVTDAQNYLLSGVITNQTNSAHLPFVKIAVNDKANTISDINGMFSIRLDEPIRQLLIATPGYHPLHMDVTDKTSPLIIELIPSKLATDSLNKDRSDIYHYIDSIMHKDQYAYMKHKQESLLLGEIEIGWLTLDMNRLKRYNQFEGVYLGLGGHTNDKLFSTVSIGGYAGYGFKDKTTKYGFDVTVWPDAGKRLALSAGYGYDTRESGGSKFFDEKNGIIDPSTFRYFYVDKMDYEQKLNFAVALKQDYVNWYFSIQRRIVNRGYDILNDVKVLIPLPDHYNVSGMIAGGRFTFKKKTVSTEAEDQSLPTIWLQFIRGVPGLFKGEYNFNRYEAKIQYAVKVKHLGRSAVQLFGNLLVGKAPYFEFFNGHGSYGNFGLYASGSFVTMHPDEFMNTKSLGFFFNHNFGTLFPRTEYFNPAPALVLNYGWGKLLSPPSGYLIPTTDMHHGFVEGGMQINNLLDLKVYGVGLGAYYRMGAYSYPTAKENLVFKIVITFPNKD